MIVLAMPDLSQIHPTIRLDHTVERQNESQHHWAIKAAIIDKLRSNPAYEGTIETEKKTGDRIADIRCQLTKSPPEIPRQFVIEIETDSSAKDRLAATADHLKFDHAVFWVFTLGALDERRKTEEILSDYMSTSPALGVASLADGELELGSPIVWDEFSLPSPILGRHELYIPTYDRSVGCYNHGDFEIDGERVAMFRRPGEGVVYISRYRENGQQTLPQLAPWRGKDLTRGIREGDIKRVSPVRGPP